MARPKSRHSKENLLTQNSQEFPRRILESRKHLRKIPIAQMSIDHLSEHLAKVGREREVPSLIELRLIEARPASIDLSAAYWTAYHEHYVRMSMIRTTIAVLVRCASEF